MNWYIIHNIRDRFHWAIRLYIVYLSYIYNFSNVLIAGLSTNRKKKGFSNEVVCQYCIIRLNEIRLSSRMLKKKIKLEIHTRAPTHIV